MNGANENLESRSVSLQVTLLVAFVVVCLSAGGLGAIATTPEIDGWYKTIEQPRPGRW